MRPVWYLSLATVVVLPVMPTIHNSQHAGIPLNSSSSGASLAPEPAEGSTVLVNEE
jgi:hypothetical protein